MKTMGTQCRAEVCFKLDTAVSVISQSDYRRAGSPPLSASTNRLVGANDNVLQSLGKCNGRLSQGGAVIDEDIYIISGQRRSLLSRMVCETSNHVKLVAVDSGETADYYKNKNPTLFGGLGRMSGGDYSIQLHEDAVPDVCSTLSPHCLHGNPFDGSHQEGATEDGGYSSGYAYGLVCGYGSRAKPRVVSSTVEGEENETHKMRICVDLTKLNESVISENRDFQYVDQTLGRLAGANVFTKLDANSGFWQIPLAPTSQELMTFITPFGRYCFRCLPFGITSARTLPEEYAQCPGRSSRSDMHDG